MRCCGRWVAIVANRVLRVSAETVAITYLNARLSGGVKASTKKSSVMPCVTVERVGGSHLSPSHDSTMLSFQAWASTTVSAERLAAEVMSWLEVMDEPNAWWSGVIGGLINYPDPVSASPRYQFTVSLMTKASAA